MSKHDCPKCDCEELPKFSAWQMVEEIKTSTPFTLYLDEDGDVWVAKPDGEPFGAPGFLSRDEVRRVAEAAGVIDG